MVTFDILGIYSQVRFRGLTIFSFSFDKNSKHCFRVFFIQIWNNNKNIARGTTDPGYWLFNLSYLSSYIECQIGQFGQHVMQ